MPDLSLLETAMCLAMRQPRIAGGRMENLDRALTAMGSKADGMCCVGMPHHVADRHVN
jgi:hypothetical protein